MTKDQIKAVLNRVRSWPEERQAYLAEIVLHIEAQDRELEPEDAATEAAVAEGLDQAKRRKFASAKRVKATWKKFGL